MISARTSTAGVVCSTEVCCPFCARVGWLSGGESPKKKPDNSQRQTNTAISDAVTRFFSMN
jgi:hypothetical protein